MDKLQTLSKAKEIAKEHARKMGFITPSLFINFDDDEGFTVVPIKQIPTDKNAKFGLFKRIGKEVSKKECEVETIAFSTEFKIIKDRKEEVNRVLVVMAEEAEWRGDDKLIEEVDYEKEGETIIFTDEQRIQKDATDFLGFKMLSGFWYGYFRDH